MERKKAFFFITLFSLVLSREVFAEKEKSHSNKVVTSASKDEKILLEKAPFVAENLETPAIDEETLNATLIEADKKRKPANNNESYAELLSPTLSALITEYHNIKTSDELADFIKKLDTNYDSYTATDVKYFAATIIPALSTRGLLYRLRNLFSIESKFVHSQMITYAKALALQADIFFPYQNSKAFVDFVAAPYYNNGVKVAEFNKEYDVQVWLVNEVVPQLIKQINRLTKLNLKTAVAWDQRAVFGPNSFADGIRRFTLVGEFEKTLQLASIHGALASIYASRAYGVNGSIRLSKEIGMVFGVDTLKFVTGSDGVSVKNIVDVLKKSDFINVGKLYTDGGPWMAKALEASRSSITYVKSAWNQSKNSRENNEDFLINTGLFNVNRETVRKNIDIVSRVILSSGTESLRSSVSGEVASINYSAFFTNPPADLKSFLPIDFDKSETVTKPMRTIAGQTSNETYRNYLFGAPTKWNTGFLATYYPGIQKDTDINKYLRVFGQMAGTWVAFTN